MLRVIGGALFAAMAFPVGSLGVWMVDRQLPTVHVEQPHPIKAHVNPGGTLVVQYRVRRFRPCALEVERLLFDAHGTRYHFEDQTFSHPPGPVGPEHPYKVPVEVPSNMAFGKAQYWVHTNYICNPVHKFWPITANPVVIDFEVVNTPVELLPK